MTDNEIIKVLEICTGDTTGCGGCPLNDLPSDCTILDRAALDLIKRQQAKIEGLSDVLSDHTRKGYAKIRAEAITEFAERLIEETRTFSGYDCGWECDVSAISAEDIDRIAKEMTEGLNR